MGEERMEEGAQHTALGHTGAQGEGGGSVLAQSDRRGVVEEKIPQKTVTYGWSWS